ncbi:MAG TPA: hypothetical protein VFD04_01535 [Actinomycetes bacterium]|nr:hypothetical protein [Actinomycetes bacterium]
MVIYTRGAGTVRYQWGRGGGDVRSEVRTYEVSKEAAAAGGNALYPATDRITGSTDSPTDTIIDRLHVLDPPGPNGPVDVAMPAKVCP